MKFVSMPYDGQFEKFWISLYGDQFGKEGVLASVFFFEKWINMIFLGNFPIDFFLKKHTV